MANGSDEEQKIFWKIDEDIKEMKSTPASYGESFFVDLHYGHFVNFEFVGSDWSFFEDYKFTSASLFCTSLFLLNIGAQVSPSRNERLL